MLWKSSLIVWNFFGMIDLLYFLQPNHGYMIFSLRLEKQCNKHRKKKDVAMTNLLYNHIIKSNVFAANGVLRKADYLLDVKTVHLTIYLYPAK